MNNFFFTFSDSNPIYVNKHFPQPQANNLPCVGDYVVYVLYVNECNPDQINKAKVIWIFVELVPTN